MDLQLWPAHTEDEVVYESMGRRSWRWVLNIEAWSIAIERQLRNAYDSASRRRPIDTWLAISLRRPFRWGIDHGYYDGPHCALHLGWLTIYWEGGLITRRCAKCEGEG